DIGVVRDRKVPHASGFPEQLAAQICARLNAAASPALVVGGDVERYGAWDAVIGLAESTPPVGRCAPPPGRGGGGPRKPSLFIGFFAPRAGADSPGRSRAAIWSPTPR